MAALTLELPPRQAQTAFNLRRWSELLAAPELNRLEGRVETDRYQCRPPLRPMQRGKPQLHKSTALRRPRKANKITRLITFTPILGPDGCPLNRM